MASLCKRPPPFFGPWITSNHGHLLRRLQYIITIDYRQQSGLQFLHWYMYTYYVISTYQSHIVQVGMLHDRVEGDLLFSSIWRGVTRSDLWGQHTSEHYINYHRRWSGRPTLCAGEQVSVPLLVVQLQFLNLVGTHCTTPYTVNTTLSLRDRFSTRRYTSVHGFCFFNPLPTNDTPMRHGLSISLWEFIWDSVLGVILQYMVSASFSCFL